MGASLLSLLNSTRTADAVILEDTSREVTLGELNADCERLAAVLAGIDAPLITLHADNGPSWVVADLTCQHLDLCLVPLPGFFSPLQLRAVLEECRAGWLLTDNPDALRALIDPATAPVDTGIGLTLCRLVTFSDKAPVMPRGTGKITFTSGSTGDPKGVCLANGQLIRQARVLADVVGEKSPRHCCVLPLATLLENVAGVYAPLLGGGRVFLPSLAALGYQGSRLAAPEKMPGLLQAVAPQTLILIPELLKLLVGAALTGWQPPDSFRFIAVGGSKVSATLLAQAHALDLPVYEGYGLSECASVVTLNTPASHRDGSCGRPLPHVSLETSDGEIVVRGNLMLGYLNRPQSWHPDSYRTGDLGRLDQDGFVHLAGRRNNLLVSSYGRNISPEWPESELLANPQLREAVVFGDARPWCAALVSSRDPALPDGVLGAWIDRVNAGLPDYAQVKAWYRLPQPLATIPGMLTRNGRPRRDAIARRFAAEIDSLYQPENPQEPALKPPAREMLS